MKSIFTRFNLIRTFLMACGALLWVALLAPTTRAQRFEITSGTEPRIIVISTKDSARYDTVVENSLAYKIGFKGRCAEKWRLRSGKIRRLDGTAEVLNLNTDNRSISPDSGQTFRYVTILSSYVRPNLATYSKSIAPLDLPSSPPKACNAELDRLVKKGSARTTLLQEGFELIAWESHDAGLEVVCQDDHVIKDYDRVYRAETKVHARIRCEGTGYKPPRTPSPDPVPPPPQRTPAPPPPQRMPPPPPPLTSVSVAANPAETTGRGCPLYVNFKGKIEPNPDSKYTTFNTKYRFVGDRGYQTDWTFVAVSRSEPRTVNGRRFIQAPANNPGGTILAPGEKPKIPLYRGWMELEVQLPNGSKRSERANFTVDCNVAPAGPRIKASN